MYHAGMLERKITDRKGLATDTLSTTQTSSGRKNFRPDCLLGLSELSGLAYPPIMSTKNDLKGTIDGATAHPRAVYVASWSYKWPPSSSPPTFGLVFTDEENGNYDNEAIWESSGANLRNYWMLGPNVSETRHPAVFPQELARRCILLGSRPGDTVLDPFSGSGTTGAVAEELQRKAVLVELNDQYVQQSEERLRKGVQESLRL